MHAAAWGRDERPVVTESEPVSMSRETTFERDLHPVRDRARGRVRGCLASGRRPRQGHVGHFKSRNGWHETVEYGI